VVIVMDMVKQCHYCSKGILIQSWLFNRERARKRGRGRGRRVVLPHQRRYRAHHDRSSFATYDSARSNVAVGPPRSSSRTSSRSSEA
jgi:hypothetical protein